MATTTNSLISDAFYAANIVSRDFESVSGSQIYDALSWLNEILTEKRVDPGMVPYETNYKFNVTPGQEIYFIPGCILIDNIVFFLESVRYSMRYDTRNEYQGSTRVESIDTLPHKWFFERQKGGGNLYIYFLPDKDYEFEINGVFDLPKVTLGQDLETIFDDFFISYLKYALVDRICSNYSVSTPSESIRQLRKFEAMIDKKSRTLDLRAKTYSSIGRSRSGLTWADVNIGHGYRPVR